MSDEERELVVKGIVSMAILEAANVATRNEITYNPIMGETLVKVRDSDVRRNMSDTITGNIDTSDLEIIDVETAQLAGNLVISVRGHVYEFQPNGNVTHNGKLLGNDVDVWAAFMEAKVLYDGTLR